jgi:acetylornithine deacetylase/succinyl-diaminopimelate desuccinylase-like protein
VFGEERIAYKRLALDMGFFSNNIVDCITFGIGDYSLANSDNEMVSISDYYDAAYFYCILLEEMIIKK